MIADYFFSLSSTALLLLIEVSTRDHEHPWSIDQVRGGSRLGIGSRVIGSIEISFHFYVREYSSCTETHASSLRGRPRKAISRGISEVAEIVERATNSRVKRARQHRAEEEYNFRGNAKKTCVVLGDG